MSQPRRFSIQTNERASASLLVEFHWWKDRYAHSIGSLVHGQHTPLLTSVEGRSDESWPPSPPVQQLSVVDHPDQPPVALGVGMAGKSHWSLSAHASGNKELPYVEFDIACRARASAGPLRTTYTAAPVTMVSGQCSQPSLIVATKTGVRLRVEPVSDSAARHACRLRVYDSRVELVPHLVDNDGVKTARWKYRIRYVGPLSM